MAEFHLAAMQKSVDRVGGGAGYAQGLIDGRRWIIS